MREKRAYIIGLSLIILVFGLWVIKNFNYRYQHNEILKPDKLSGLRKAPVSNPSGNSDNDVDYVVLNDKRQKAPDFKFIDQNGDTITQDNYAGKVYLVEFFYTTCPTICPIMNENLGEIADEFKNNKKFGIASFSIDSKHDTPKVLKEYAENHGITHPNWHLLTGNRDSIYSLAENGFRITTQEDPNEPGGILHDGMFALIDKEGYFRARKDEYGNSIIYYRGYIKRNSVAEVGEKPQINELIEDIKSLLHE